MLNKIFSMQMAVLLLFAFAFAIGGATFIENDYGTQSARALVYNAKWFEVLLIFITLNLIYNIFKFKMYKKEKMAQFIFHISFILIIIGAGVTRYVGFEGIMHIREGASSNTMMSDIMLLQVDLKKDDSKSHFEKVLYLSSMNQNSLKENISIADNNINIELLEYLPNVTKQIIKDKNSKDSILELMVSTTNQPGNPIVLEKGKSIDKGSFIISFEEKIITSKPVIYISESSSGKITMNSPYDFQTVLMKDQSKENIGKGENIDFNQKTLYQFDDGMFVLKKIYPNASMKMLSSSIKSTSGLPDMLRIKVSNQDDSKIVEIQGTKATIGDTKELIINGIKVSLTYGSKIIPIPFDIKLVDFELQRYPGSNTPSSYASDVILIDKEQNINKPYRIFMNHILEHRGYRFFQSSYDMDEKGTILSVNHDPGTLPTYIGYFLLALGMFWTLFSTKSRFQQLLRGTRKLQQGALSIFAILIFSLTPSYSSDELNHIDNFSKLVIQDNQGRMKPLDTLTSQVIAKITRKSSFLGMNANQLFLRMMIQPEKYQDKAMIKIGHPKIAKALNMPIDTKYLKFSDFFEKEGNGYILYNEVSNATRKKPAQRDQYDKELIKVDERVNISYMVYTGSLFKIFPKPHDTNNLWLSPIDAIQNLPEKDSKMAQMIIFNYFDAVGKAIDSDNWTQAEKALDIIKQYQNKFGSEVLPTDSQINLEVIYNHLGIFGKLIPLYLIVGLILLILSFIHILKRSFNLKLYTQIVLSIIILGFAVHTIGLGVRWYISGHAPWSNAYESIVYIAWATLLAGFLFMKNSPITLASTAILSGVLLFVAHLNWLDPQITTLMPVLKSYWLMIHVAVITASYGFLGLGALLAFVTFTLYILKTESNQENINKSIKELSKINEMSLIIGLILLTIGNFLGGVWANESWGRYWGWDSKETWAAVTILIYSVVIHLRFIPKLNSIFIYNIASLVAYSSVLMTYFGVNFYLSGLHSYAAGDPLPIPSWVLPSVFVIFAIIILAYLRDKAIKKN